MSGVDGARFGYGRDKVWHGRDKAWAWAGQGLGMGEVLQSMAH